MTLFTRQRAELHALYQFLAEIDDAYDESSDAEEVDRAVKEGLDRVKADLRRVKEDLS